MDTYLVTAENVVLLFGEGERVEARKTVEDCLIRRGLSVWPELEAELYSGRGGTLLLARPAPPASARGRSVSVRLKR